MPVVAFEITVSLWMVRLDPWAGLLSVALLAVFMALAVRALRIGFAQVSLEDRAVIEYGAEFDALKEKQRAEIFQRAVRDGLFGHVKVDEHEAEQRLRAQGDAYRLLGPALFLFLAGYWAVCLFGPFGVDAECTRGDRSGGDLAGALVLAAPTMIRMWTQPDELGGDRSDCRVNARKMGRKTHFRKSGCAAKSEEQKLVECALRRLPAMAPG